MNPTITAFLTLVQKLLPLVAGQIGPVGVIIEEIVQIAPTVIQVGGALIPQIKDIIAALQADPATAQAQFDQLDAINAAADAKFDADAAKAEAEDDAAGQG